MCRCVQAMHGAHMQLCVATFCCCYLLFVVAVATFLVVVTIFLVATAVCCYFFVVTVVILKYLLRPKIKIKNQLPRPIASATHFRMRMSQPL